MSAGLCVRGMYKREGEVLGSEKGMKPEGKKLSWGYSKKNRQHGISTDTTADPLVGIYASNVNSGLGIRHKGH